MPWKKVRPVFTKEILSLCTYPYRGHPRGCPNFGRKSGCPPKLAPVDICLDECYAIYVKFPLAEHVEKMRRRHPDWSYHQLANLLYWQRSFRKRSFRPECERFLATHPGFRVSPREVHIGSHGLDVTTTMKQVGVVIQWPPKDYCIEVTFAGHPLSTAGPKRMARLLKQFPLAYADKRLLVCGYCQRPECINCIDVVPESFVGWRFKKLFVAGVSTKPAGWHVACMCGAKYVAKTVDSMKRGACPRCLVGKKFAV